MQISNIIALLPFMAVVLAAPLAHPSATGGKPNLLVTAIGPSY